MEKVILDCDNTFGLPNRDIDDGLTLLYLLGEAAGDLLGVSLTHGNGTPAEVLQATQTFKTCLQLQVETYPDPSAALSAPAFLAQQVAAAPHEVTILATGALTNLYSASQIDSDFFKKTKQIIVMGGVTHPLQVNGRLVHELNFSADTAAAQAVLLSGANITIMNGQLTAHAFFSVKELKALQTRLAEKIPARAFAWFQEVITAWLEWNQIHFGFNGFCNWDMTTALFLTHPALFSAEEVLLAPQQTQLAEGILTFTNDPEKGKKVRMPAHLLDLEAFNQFMVAAISKAF